MKLLTPLKWVGMISFAIPYLYFWLTMILLGAYGGFVDLLTNINWFLCVSLLIPHLFIFAVATEQLSISSNLAFAVFVLYLSASLAMIYSEKIKKIKM